MQFRWFNPEADREGGDDIREKWGFFVSSIISSNYNRLHLKLFLRKGKLHLSKVYENVLGIDASGLKILSFI